MSWHGGGCHIADHLGKEVSHLLEAVPLESPSGRAVEFNLQRTIRDSEFEFVYIGLCPSGCHGQLGITRGGCVSSRAVVGRAGFEPTTFRVAGYAHQLRHLPGGHRSTGYRLPFMKPAPLPFMNPPGLCRLGGPLLVGVSRSTW